MVERVAGSARQAFRELRQGDRVSVMVFNSRSSVVAPFTEDLDAVDRSIREDVLARKFGGGTRIQSAVDDAALRFLHEKRSQRRRAVLIVTDNIGQRTRREESVVRDFWEADALLSGLIVPNPAFQALRTVGIVLGPQNLLMQAGMKGIAQKTGGDAIRADDARSRPFRMPSTASAAATVSTTPNRRARLNPHAASGWNSPPMPRSVIPKRACAHAPAMWLVRRRRCRGAQRRYSARRALTGSMRTARITAGTAASSAAARIVSEGMTNIPTSPGFTW